LYKYLIKFNVLVFVNTLIDMSSLNNVKNFLMI